METGPYTPLHAHVVEADAAGPQPPSARLRFSDARLLLEPGQSPIETGSGFGPHGHARMLVRTTVPFRFMHETRSRPGWTDSCLDRPAVEKLAFALRASRIAVTTWVQQSA